MSGVGRSGAGLASYYAFFPPAGALARSLSRSGVTPNQLSLGNAAFGLAGGGIAYAALATELPSRLVTVAALLWCVGYALDCADGQLARLTGKGSVNGAVVDLCCDYVVHGAVYGALAAAFVHEEQIGLGVALWIVWAGTAGLFMAGLQNLSGVQLATDAADVDDRSVSPVVGIVRQVQDYGLHLLVFVAVGLLYPPALPLVVVVIAAVNTAGFGARLALMSAR